MPVKTYSPLQPGIPRVLQQDVTYEEQYPGAGSPAYCFWALRTEKVLQTDFEYLVLPDACVDIVFDVSAEPTVAGAIIMTPQIIVTRLNLGRSCNFVGIRLWPGAWLASPQEIIGKLLPVDMLGGCDLQRVQRRLRNAVPAQRTAILQQLVVELERRTVISLSHLSNLHVPSQSVGEYARTLCVSRRHLQRLFQKHFGYNPHDFIKITRFQQALRQRSALAYADQSHYIREFKRITQLTPTEFQTRY